MTRYQNQQNSVNCPVLHDGVRKRPGSSSITSLLRRAAVLNILAAVIEGRYGISHRHEEFCSLRTRIKHLRNNVRRQERQEPARSPVKSSQPA